MPVLLPYSPAEYRAIFFKPDTSAASLWAYKESGKHAEECQRVWLALLEYGPMTGRELERCIQNQDGHKRAADLEGEGMVLRSQQRPCRVTGRMAWENVATLPSFGVWPKPKVVKKRRSRKPNSLLAYELRQRWQAADVLRIDSSEELDLLVSKVIAKLEK